VAFYQRFSANKKTGAAWAPVGLRVSLTRLWFDCYATEWLSTSKCRQE